MPSSVAWMDTSARELRQAHEIIRLFEDKEGRDELGIGTVRDALSNALFPGTSVLLTRARYFLFIPWIYTLAAERAPTDEAFAGIVEKLERDLVDQLIRENAGDGIIGARAGRNVQNLPSTLYWNGLRAYGIVNARRVTDIPRPRSAEDVTSELAKRSAAPLAQLPPRPEGFPHGATGGFDLSHDEAVWLREHIVANRRGTPLAALLEPGKITADLLTALTSSHAPWLHPLINHDPRVEQARLFSRAMLGASFLYNLLLAESAGREGMVEKAEWSDHYREKLTAWQRELSDDAAFHAWTTPELWREIDKTATVPMLTRRFVDTWVGGVRRCCRSGTPVADSGRLRDLVAQRERRKGAQSRLSNPRMLATWQGAAGTRGLSYRWFNVRRIVVDIWEGLMR